MTFLGHYIAQSKTTGRFLLRKKNTKWTFPFAVDLDVPYQTKLLETKEHWDHGVFGDSTFVTNYLSSYYNGIDDAVITVRPGRNSFCDHIWLPSEKDFPGCQWFNFTQFPSECGPGVFRAFNDPHMIRVFYSEP